MFEEDEFEILKKQAEGLEVPVREKVWQNISSRLVKPNYLIFRFGKLPVGLSISLVVGFIALYTIEQSMHENVMTTHESQIPADTPVKNHNQIGGSTSPRKSSSVKPLSQSEISFEAGEKRVVNEVGMDWSETGNEYKADDPIREVTFPKLTAIPVQPFQPFELSPSYGNKGMPHKLEEANFSMKKPPKGVTISSVDFGMGACLNYTKRQPKISNPLEQHYAEYINSASQKMIPFYGRMMVNFELPWGMSVGTGLQFIHFRERVTYDVVSDSILVLEDDGRGGIDTVVYYYDYSVPGPGFNLERRTSLFQLPVMLNLSWKLHKNLNAELNAGVSIGLYSIHRSKSEHEHIPGIISFMMRQDHSSFLYSFGAQASAGLEYRISDNTGIALKLNYYSSIGGRIESFNLLQRSFGSELSYRLTIR